MNIRFCLLFPFILSGMAFALPADESPKLQMEEKPSGVTLSPEEAARAVKDEVARLEQVGESDDLVAAINAARRLWSHYGVEGNEEKSRYWWDKYCNILEKRAESGELDAIMILAMMYSKGAENFPQNLVKARQWFEKAAEKGDPTAQYHVATMYATGLGGGKDEKKASEWFSKAREVMSVRANNNDAKAAFWVGQMYFQGLGVDVDYKKAFEYFMKSAESGYLRSELIVAFLYREGKGCERDEKKSVEWFKKAAEQKDLGAIMEVALAYQEGKGVEKNAEEARKWLEKGVKLGDPYAMRALAIMYEDGKLGEKDGKKALEYYRMAASKDPYSALQAARLLKPVDAEQAYQFVRRTAEQYQYPAVVYEQALWEKERGDSAMFAKLLQQAAENGYTPAMTELGKLHLIPFGEVSWNPRISHYWWNIAEKRGDREAASCDRWLLWGGGSLLAVFVAVFLFLLNRFIKKKQLLEESVK